ncbi:developmentally-regulated protein [Acrasis kona]|uniref:Developmentally-regulated protein n=1 Tax=Acrasis kona TaxID=1008807 RepID=A0AAW2YHL8_9EUKA
MKQTTDEKNVELQVSRREKLKRFIEDRNKKRGEILLKHAIDTSMMSTTSINGSTIKTPRRSVSSRQSMSTKLADLSTRKSISKVNNDKARRKSTVVQKNPRHSIVVETQIPSTPLRVNNTSIVPPNSSQRYQELLDWRKIRESAKKTKPLMTPVKTPSSVRLMATPVVEKVPPRTNPLAAKLEKALEKCKKKDRVGCDKMFEDILAEFKSKATKSSYFWVCKAHCEQEWSGADDVLKIFEQGLANEAQPREKLNQAIEAYMANIMQSSPEIKNVVVQGSLNNSLQNKENQPVDRAQDDDDYLISSASYIQNTTQGSVNSLSEVIEVIDHITSDFDMEESDLPKATRKTLFSTPRKKFTFESPPQRVPITPFGDIGSSTADRSVSFTPRTESRDTSTSNIFRVATPGVKRLLPTSPEQIHFDLNTDVNRSPPTRRRSSNIAPAFTAAPSTPISAKPTKVQTPRSILKVKTPKRPSLNGEYKVRTFAEDDEVESLYCSEDDDYQDIPRTPFKRNVVWSQVNHYKEDSVEGVIRMSPFGADDNNENNNNDDDLLTLEPNSVNQSVFFNNTLDMTMLPNMDIESDDDGFHSANQSFESDEELEEFEIEPKAHEEFEEQEEFEPQEEFVQEEQNEMFETVQQVSDRNIRRTARHSNIFEWEQTLGRVDVMVPVPKKALIGSGRIGTKYQYQDAEEYVLTPSRRSSRLLRKSLSDAEL